MSSIPPIYTAASGDEELEHLKELLAEAEETCLVLALEKHLEARQAGKEAELFSRATCQIKIRSTSSSEISSPRRS